MRRKDCEVTDIQEMLSMVKKSDALRLGLVDSDGLAYIVPVNFGYEVCSGILTFYFHSALEGKKVELLKNTARISFELDTSHALQESDIIYDHTYHYESVMGTAAVSFVKDETEKRRVLQLLMENYTGRDNWELPQSLVDHVHAIRLTVESWSAKRH